MIRRAGPSGPAGVPGPKGPGLLLFSLLLLIASVSPAAAQYRVDYWTTEHGLPQGSINAILQTQDGFLWVTTWGGLARFDGTAFRVFDTTTNPEMRSTRLASLLEDKDSRLWIRSYDGDLMRMAGGKFETFTTAHGLPHHVVDEITLTGGDILAETTRGYAIWRGDRFVPYAPPGVPLDGQNGVKVVGTSRAGAIWYRTSDGPEVHRYEAGKPARTFTQPFVGGMYEDREGRLWMRQNGELVGIFDNVERRFGAKDGLPKINVLSFYEDPDGTLWLTQAGGLVRYRNGRFSVYTTADGLPESGPRALYQDREGTHWLGTQGGLARLTDRSITAYTSADGLEADPVYPIIQDRRGTIWIGSWNGLTQYRDGVFEPVGKKFNLQTTLLSLFEDRDGSIWAGAYGGGVRHITGDRVTTYPGSEDSPNVTFTIKRLRGGELVFGALDGGVFVHREGRFSRLTSQERAASGEVHALHEDANGALWIGSDVLTKYAGGRVTTIDERSGFTGRRVRSFYEDRQGTLWIGTYDSGVFRFRDGRFTRYTTREGLPANGAFEILEDAQNRFWMSSNAGVYRIAKGDLDAVADGRRPTVTAVSYGRQDGMANQECSGIGHPGALRARDGRLWFATQKGVSVLDPSTLRVATTPPPVAFLELLVGGQLMSPRDRIEIRSGDSSVEAHYAALTFVRPELARFKYRMEGLDPDWVDAGTDRQARYARLPYGSFRFRVMAANRDGVWNEHGASVAIVVVRPFWRTTWFTALMVVFAAATGFGVHRWRLGLLEAQRQLQETFSRQLIDSQEADRKRIAAGLHDGVSQSLIIIKNWALRVERTLPDDHAARTRVGEIATTASAALGEVRDVVEDLVPYQLERLGLAQAVRDMAERIESSTGMRLTCDLAELDHQLSTESEISLFRVVQESLNNVVKHSGAAAVSIDMTAGPRLVSVKIQDDGRGFTPAAPGPSQARGGFGVLGMSERARMMGGRMIIDSAPGRGTTVSIEIPTIRGEERPS